MGDGLLAIFPLSDPNACAKLLKAIDDGRQRIELLNDKLAEDAGRCFGMALASTLAI
jgi:adenylate cyclase